MLLKKSISAIMVAVILFSTFSYSWTTEQNYLRVPSAVSVDKEAIIIDVGDKTTAPVHPWKTSESFDKFFEETIKRTKITHPKYWLEEGDKDDVDRFQSCSLIELQSELKYLLMKKGGIESIGKILIKPEEESKDKLYLLKAFFKRMNDPNNPMEMRHMLGRYRGDLVFAKSTVKDIKSQQPVDEISLKMMQDTVDIKREINAFMREFVKRWDEIEAEVISDGYISIGSKNSAIGGNPISVVIIMVVSYAIYYFTKNYPAVGWLNNVANVLGLPNWKPETSSFPVMDSIIMTPVNNGGVENSL